MAVRHRWRRDGPVMIKCRPMMILPAPETEP
jgi:hypothetical protein